MSAIRREDVERIASLASLAVEEETLPTLTAQIGRILEYVSQLESVATAPPPVDVFRPSPGPDQPLRADHARRPHPPIDPSAFAPSFEDGLFLGPSPGQLEDE